VPVIEYILGPFGLVESHDPVTNDGTDDCGISITKYNCTVWCAEVDVMSATLQVEMLLLLCLRDLVQISMDYNYKC
jgi:hypothetical protein